MMRRNSIKIFHVKSSYEGNIDFKTLQCPRYVSIAQEIVLTRTLEILNNPS